MHLQPRLNLLSLILQVAVISGGGAGHEPSHGGLVAAGMLTAAVSGDVFASPHVRAILAAIRHSSTVAAGTASPGCVLIVKNYTGDRLAFGLAAETARAEGIPVEVVFVADDAAVDGGTVTGRRGLAGTCLVHKVAGALAEAGAPLALVAAAARSVAANVVSVGASLSVCSVPGAALSDRLKDGDGMMEIGLGIHGEPGKQRVGVMTADALAVEMITILANRISVLRKTDVSTATPSSPIPVAVFINDLKGMSSLEMGIFTGSVIRALGGQGRGSAPSAGPLREGDNASAASAIFDPKYLLVGPVMTSLDMKGVSIALLPLDIDGSSNTSGTASGASSAAAISSVLPAWPASSPLALIDALAAPTSCPHWPQLVDLSQTIHGPTLVPMPAAPSSSSAAAGAPAAAVAGPLVILQAVTAALQRVSQALTASEAELCRLDALAGDGDAGLTMKTLACASFHAVSSLQPAGVGASTGHTGGLVGVSSVLGCIGDAIADAAGGTSGVLYALMFKAAQAAVTSSASSSSDASTVSLEAALAVALTAGVGAAMRYGGAHAGDRTMVDALLPAAAALADGAVPAAVTAAASAGAEATKDMAPKAGRASYVAAERCRGERDAGAHAVAVWIAALTQGL